MGALALPIVGLTSNAATAGVAVGAGAGAATGATVGLLSNPITAIAGAALGVFQLVDGIFKAHHAQAVRTEADALNNAIPAVEQSFSGIVSEVDAGQITVDQADQGLDATLSGYDNLVYNTFGAKKKSGNGLDYIHGVFADDAAKIKGLLSGPGGSLTIPSIPGHAGSVGAAALSLNFAKPVAPNDPAGVLSSVVSALTPTPTVSGTGTAAASALPSWIVYGVLALLALLLLRAL